MRLPVVLALACAACSGKQEDDNREQTKQTEPQLGQLVRGDAGVTAIVTGADPATMQMDGAVTPRHVQPQPAARERKPIDITLRSTPPGAQVAVDGRVIGNTPAYWSGNADGREHEFVFTMRGYAIARYRFVPVTSGVIHGRLDPIHEGSDAGVPLPPPELVPPRPPTSMINPPSAPPTMAPAPDAGSPPGVQPPQPPVTVPSKGSGQAPIGPQP